MGLAILIGAELNAALHGDTAPPMFAVVELPLAVGLASAVVAHGFLRRALADVSTPVSRGVVYSSFSALAAGLFVLSIGLAAQVATLTRWSPDEVLIITFGFLAVLGGVILLLSNRFQRTLRRFVDRNFYVNRYDYRARWSQTMAAVVNATEPDGLLDCVAEFLRDVFSAEAITIALRDETSGCIHVRRGKGSDGSAPPLARDSALYGHLSRERKALILDRKPHDLTYVPIYAEDGAWLDATACRVVAPLLEGNDLVGIVGLERRSGGDSFTYEDAALLESIAAHVTSALRSLRLAGELAEAREAELMSQWSSMLLHDLKNYLSPLRLAAANLTEAKHDPDVTLLCARDIRRVAERMERLVHRLAELRANPRLGMAPISSEQIVRAAVADMQLARREGIAVELAFAATRPLLGDMDMLRRVFENLISNALDAMENGGTLRIATDDVQVGGRWRVRITVADTGRGIPESFLKERMFRPFATTKKGGLGLGLYQSRSIVRAHGGELTATSTPGQGTVFQISLDAAVEMPSEGVPFKPRPILRGVVLSERSSKS